MGGSVCGCIRAHTCIHTHARTDTGTDTGTATHRQTNAHTPAHPHLHPPTTPTLFRFEPEFIEHRRAALQTFIFNVCAHPQLRDAPELAAFCTSSSLQVQPQTSKPPQPPTPTPKPPQPTPLNPQPQPPRSCTRVSPCITPSERRRRHWQRRRWLRLRGLGGGVEGFDVGGLGF